MGKTLDSPNTTTNTNITYIVIKIAPYNLQEGSRGAGEGEGEGGWREEREGRGEGSYPGSWYNYLTLEVKI